MSNKAIILMKKYIESSSEISNLSELYALDSEYAAKLEAEGAYEFEELLHAVSEHTRRFIQQLEEKNGVALRAAELTGAARNEYLIVQRLLDENLLTYHFQPIVRADDGNIFAYEALMRADGIEGITPFHILKYAELAGRLGEVEEYTFLNVLNMLNKDRGMLHGRPVFINSMANVGTSPEKKAEIERLFADKTDIVVVEITESSELGDDELSDIKSKFGTTGIPIAIDDFGTGYSNITNLMRYKPNFVKIDRSLISGIDSNANKKHFVRELTDFCRDNNIRSLAEGVETSEELRTVILLGVDLIQGFYTARPSAEAVTDIPYALRAEIRACKHELEDGRRLKIYSAEKYDKISLERLGKEGYSCIHIGFGYNDGSVTVTGSNHYDSGVHIICADGYNGTIVLENAHLSNVVGRPCIDLGSESTVTIRLNGYNKLTNGGIRVHESSQLITEGQGDLDIRLSNSDYYGIGNDLSSAHGRLEFGQDGTISVTAKSHTGVCIGAGLGGKIAVGRGRYVIEASGASNIGFGAYDGNTNIEMLGCDLEISESGAFSVGIGSVSGDAKIHMIYSSVKLRINGQMAAGVGTLMGKNADVHIESMSISEEMRAEELTAAGSLRGDSKVTVSRASVNINADGTKALGFGGQTGRTEINFLDIDLLMEMSNALDIYTAADKDSVSAKGGRYRITLNGRERDAF